MEIVKMKLSELNPAEYNPRKALKPGDPAYEKLKASILSFGNVEPIVWNRSTGNVIGGHQRLRVLLDLGVEESEVSVVDLSEVDEKRLNIALNKITGEWDDEKLTSLLADITACGARWAHHSDACGQLYPGGPQQPPQPHRRQGAADPQGPGR